MSKGSLKQVEFEFTALVGAVTEIKHKQASKFYLTWKIVHDNQGKEVMGTQSLQPDKNGVIGFSTELKTNVKIIFNKDTNTYLKKKSMLCLNYIDDQNQKQPKLGGLVTIDLASLASRTNSGGFVQYTLQRSPFKNSTITIKIVSKKLKQQLINSFSWDSNDLSFQSLMERSKDISTKSSLEKKSNPNRKNINKIIKQQFNDKRTATQVSEQSVKQSLQKQRVENQNRELKQQNQRLLSKIHALLSQNEKLKQNQTSLLFQRTKTQESELIEGDNQESTIQTYYSNLLEQNKYILTELENVSLKLAKREQEMSVLKCQYDKLKKREKKKEKETKPESIELQHQVYYLSQQIMRLHEELSNYRQTQIENNELKRQKQSLQIKLNELKAIEMSKNQEISRLNESIPNSNETQYTEQQNLLDTQNSINSSPNFKSFNKSLLSTSVPLLRSSLKQGLSDISNRYNENINTKIQDIANEVLKLKNVSLNGMTMQNKKNFLSVVKKLENRVSEAINV